ncbi:MAG TPA: acyl-CoA dehydrogenase family protein [Dissulfurispiraceae bacterium]|nr:acyl-CoA dehydrogenase family protein [Dissulfurispiraceae bacterium]
MFYLKEQKNILRMLFPGADQYDAMLDSIGVFVEQEILPDAKRIDQEESFPRHSLNKLVRKGVMAIPFPQESGGLGLPHPVYIAALEMVARACANTALQMDVQNMVCEGIRLFGEDRQKNELFLKQGLVEGRKLIAFALTEPCCGSDAKAIRTQAVLSGDKYILNGSKTLITNPGEADFVLVFARTSKGISAFIVARETPGFNVTGIIPKLGFRGNKLSSVSLKDCAVPRENLLGEEGHGLEYSKQILNAGRMSIAAIAVGIAQAAYEKALSYSKRREAFGKSLSNFQLIQEKLADMVTEINAARLLTYYAASLKERGESMVSEASQAKLFSSEMALRVCDRAIQIHGGYGYTDALDVHRHWRDARLLTIGEGTSDILRLLIAHLALKNM